MSSTSNAQNLLVNVFRPAYVYSSTTGYVPKLVLSNLDVISATTMQVSTASVSDSGNNVYLGSNAGGLVNSSNFFNVAVGVGAESGCSNTQGTIAIGYQSFANITNSCNSIGIGTNTIGGGVSNVILGANSGTTGSSNVFLGCGLQPASAVSNTFYLGMGSVSNVTLTGDLSNRRLGINTRSPQATLDVSGDMYVRQFVGVGVDAPLAAIHANGFVYATQGFAAEPGSADAPMLAFLDVSTTGLYKSAEGGLAVTTNGTYRAQFTDTCLSVVGTVDVSGAVSASSGYSSIRGTATGVAAGGTQTIGTLRLGSLAINVQEATSTGSNYASLLVYASDAAGGTAPVNLSSNVQNGDANIVFSTSNIQVSNSGAGSSNFLYTITYFPLS